MDYEPIIDHDVHDWHVTHDVDAFLARAGDLLHSRPAAHTVRRPTG
ncbi:hypothetical protein [Streptomyces sp. NPDC002324]